MRGHNRITAALIGELEEIRASNGGSLKPSDVLEFAKAHPESAAHHYFDWDSEFAAEQWWLLQARALIVRAKVRIVDADKTVVSVRAYASLRDDRREGGGYRATVEVLADDTLRAQLVETALKELEALREKYDQLHELGPVFEVIDRVWRRRGAA
jgi:hypothetical protein